jgi:hypothetical protein
MSSVNQVTRKGRLRVKEVSRKTIWLIKRLVAPCQVIKESYPRGYRHVILSSYRGPRGRATGRTVLEQPIVIPVTGPWGEAGA